MGSLVAFVFIPVVVLAGAALQLTRSPQPRTLGHAAEVFLVWVLVVWGRNRKRHPANLKNLPHRDHASRLVLSCRRCS